MRKKNTFYQQIQSKKWIFSKELLIFNDQKLFLLSLSILTFIKESFELNILLNVSLNIQNSNLLHPFSSPLLSMSGYVFKIFKLLYLNNEDIFCVKNEFAKSCEKVSKLEYEWGCVMNFLYPEEQLISEFNNENGQKKFKIAHCDLFSEIKKKAYFFNGCVIHSCLKTNCPFNRNAKSETLNPFGVTFKEINDKFYQKMENLLITHGNEIDEIVIEWQCTYLEKRKDPLIKSFLELQFKDHPLHRLQSRSCCRGGYVDVLGLKWTKELFPNEKFVYLDKNGMYSYVSIKFPFMVGKYQIIMGDKLNNISIKNNKFYYNDCKIMGACLLTIIPPQNLFLPFLMYRRKKDRKTFNTLCKLCCETETLICKHSEKERAITASYMISEIEYALTLNYKILSIHEMHIYTKSKFIFKDFIQKLNFLKTKYSDCFSECTSLDEKQKYCDKLNKTMDLNSDFQLTPNNIKVNDAKRNFYKLWCNSIFGKLQQKHNLNKIIYVSTSKEIEDIYFSGNEIKDIYSINDQLCQIEVERNPLKIPPNLKSNCYLGAQICSYGRQIIHQDAMKLISLNYKLFQINCDSLMFSMPECHEIPFEVSNVLLGNFKYVMPKEIVNYFSLGPKSYSVTCKESPNVFKTVSKICGLQLKGNLIEKDLNEELFSFYLEQFFLSQYHKLNVEQKRHKRNFKKLKVSEKISNISFSNQITSRRFLSNGPYYKTFPYGFSILNT